MYIVFKQRGLGTRVHAWGPYTPEQVTLCLVRLRKDRRARVWEAEAVLELPQGTPLLPFGARPEATPAEAQVASIMYIEEA